MVMNRKTGKNDGSGQGCSEKMAVSARAGLIRCLWEKKPLVLKQHTQDWMIAMHSMGFVQVVRQPVTPKSVPLDGIAG